VMSLEDEVVRLRAEIQELRRLANDAVSDAERRTRRDLVPISQALSLFGQRPSIFRNE
ncbi:MAG: MerR family transcriptional regulator, partial [Ilumatobacteraceae bacterium]|nr:MerR family transcriptional regulator [Ilumatobacteraceae bacterium]